MTLSVIEQRYQLHEVASRILLDPIFFNDQEKQQREFILSLLSDPEMSEEHRNKLKREIYPRVSKCHKVPLMNGKTTNHIKGVAVKRSREHKAFSFGGLMSCGSVFLCPICSAKISEYRSEEIAKAFKVWNDLNPNHTQIMITFTIPHYANQSISDLREIFMKARRLLKQQKVLKRKVKLFDKKISVYSQLKDKYNVKGSISGIEITYGYNGWHPHSHDVFFLSSDISDQELSEFKQELTEAWIYACERAKLEIKNLDHMKQRSIKIDRARSAQEYISKYGQVDFDAHKDILTPGWGVAQELTKSHLKRSRGDKGFTPWDLLRIILANQDDDKIYLKFGSLFKKYARTFHGKRQLFWSKGFKKLLGIDTMTDEEIAEDEQDETCENIGIIPGSLFKEIVYYKLRGWVLNLAKEMDIQTDDDFKSFLARIRQEIESYEQTKKSKTGT